MVKSLFLLIVTTIGLSFPAFSVTPEALSKPSLFHGVKLSPDGEKLGVIIEIEGLQRLAVFDVETFEAIGGAQFRNSYEVSNFHWVNEERVVIEMAKKRGIQAQSISYGELFAVNYDGSQQELIFGYRAGETQTGTLMKVKEGRRAWAEVINLLPDDPKHILISSTPMSTSGGRYPSVHKLNVYNGKLSRKVAYAPVPYTTFVTDKEGDVKIAIGTKADNEKYVFRRDGDEWSDVSSAFGSRFWPVALTENAEELFYVDNYRQDKTGVFKLNLKTGEKKPIYTDPNVDIYSSDINLTVDRSTAYAAMVNDGYPTYVIFDNTIEEAKLFKALINTFNGYKVRLTSKSSDGMRWVIYVSDDITPGRYYLFDRKTNKLKSLFVNMDHLDTKQMALTEPFSYQSSDGLTVHGYITYPMNMKEGDKVPMVTMVHGGPHGVRDGWFFDREVQLLAAQGYAVMRVNYRGSGGYGASFLYAGYREWGGKIQQDIIEATQHVISLGKVDPERVGIMGGSFGGYSAVMASTIAPDLFKSAVAMVGVYDLELMFDEGDIPDRLYGKSYLIEALGEDREVLRRFSPINHVENLKGPVLIVHGERDERVPFVHAERLRDALEEHNKPFEWLVMSDETHGFYDPENRREYYQAVIDFFGKHL